MAVMGMREGKDGLDHMADEAGLRSGRLADPVELKPMPSLLGTIAAPIKPFASLVAKLVAFGLGCAASSGSRRR